MPFSDSDESALQAIECIRFRATPDNNTHDRRPVEMTDGQIRAALGLLRTTLPDLAVTQIEGSHVPLAVDFRWADGGTVQPLPSVSLDAADTHDDLVVWAGENG